MTNVRTFEVSDSEADIRLDRWFKRRLPGLAHGHLERLLRTGQIRVDGARAKSGQRLAPGQRIRVPPLAKAGARRHKPEIPVSSTDAADLRHRVLYRDPDVIALDKPPGLAVQGGSKTLRHLDAMLDALRFEAKAAGNLSRRLRVLTHPALLVVDEIGYEPVNQDGAVLFFQLINARHERASTVLTSNKGFEDWGGVLGDEVMAAALIDRLVHHCHIVNIRGNSYRMKDHQNLLQSGSDRRRKRAAS